MQSVFAAVEHRQIEVDSIDRQFIVYQPPGVKPNAALLLVFHGYTGDAERMMAYTGLNKLADKYGFVVAYPQGTQDSLSNNFFNVGYSFHADSEIDEIRFVRSLVAELVDDIGVDASRV